MAPAGSTATPPAGQLQAAASITGADGQTRSYQYQRAGTGWAVTSASHIPLDESLEPIRQRQLRDGLLQSQSDFAGNTQTHEWDASRQLLTRHTRAAGRPEQTRVQTEWHPQWALPVKVTETGSQGGARVTEYTYDSQGNLTGQRTTDSSANPPTAAGATTPRGCWRQKPTKPATPPRTTTTARAGASRAQTRWAAASITSTTARTA